MGLHWVRVKVNEKTPMDYPCPSLEIGLINQGLCFLIHSVVQSSIFVTDLSNTVWRLPTNVTKKDWVRLVTDWLNQIVKQKSRVVLQFTMSGVHPLCFPCPAHSNFTNWPTEQIESKFKWYKCLHALLSSNPVHNLSSLANSTAPVNLDVLSHGRVADEEDIEAGEPRVQNDQVSV